MRVLVVGATGVLGRQVLPRLLERGHTVRALVRRETHAATLARLGVETAPGDILDAASLIPATTGCDAVLHLATAIPKPGGAQDWRLNDRIRREGTQLLLAAVAQAGVPRYVQQSITFLYGDQGTRLADETTSLQPAPLIQSAADMEALVQAAPDHVEWCILRGGAFYGPGTGREEGWRQAAREGGLPLPGDGSGLQSLIHVVDMARAVVLAAEAAPTGAIYNVVDDEPVTYRQLYGHVAALVEGPDPTPGGETVLPSLGCANARVKAALGWSPAYPTYRSGLA